MCTEQTRLLSVVRFISCLASIIRFHDDILIFLFFLHLRYRPHDRITDAEYEFLSRQFTQILFHVMEIKYGGDDGLLMPVRVYVFFWFVCISSCLFGKKLLFVCLARIYRHLGCDESCICICGCFE